MPNFERPQNPNNHEEDAKRLVKAMMGEDVFERDEDNTYEAFKDALEKEKLLKNSYKKLEDIKNFQLSGDIIKDLRDLVKKIGGEDASQEIDKNTDPRDILQAIKEVREILQRGLESTDTSDELDKLLKIDIPEAEIEVADKLIDYYSDRYSSKKEKIKKSDVSDQKQDKDSKSKEDKELQGSEDMEEEKQVEGVEQKKISDKVVQRFKEEMNIKKEELESLDGFDKLSEGQQLLTLENLKQLTLGRIEEEASNEFKKEMGESKFLERLWKSVSKHYQLGKLQESKGEDILKGGMEVHQNTLKQLVAGLKEFGPEVEIKEDGSLEIGFLNVEEDLDKSKKDKLKNFNKIANEFARTPEEWKNSTSKTQRKKFEEVKEKYEQARQVALGIKKGKQGKEGASLEINNAEHQVYINRSLNHNPEVEKALQNIKNKKTWKNASRDIVTEKGAFFGAGFAARSGATALLGSAGASLAAFGAPVGAAGIGGYRGWKRAQEDLAEKDKEAKRGGSGQVDQELYNENYYKYYVEKDVGTEKDVVDWNYYSEALESFEDILDSELSTKEQKEEALKSLRYHIEEINSKIDKGGINFGGDDNRFYNQYSLAQRLGQAQAKEAEFNFLKSHEYLKGGKKTLDGQYEEDKKVVDEFIAELEGLVKKNRKKYAAKKALQSAGTSAGFAFAGQWLGGRFAESLGWKRPEAEAGLDKNLGDQEKGSEEEPEEPNKDDQEFKKPKKLLLEVESPEDSELSQEVFELKKEHFDKIKKSRIKDADVINVIAKNNEVADWEISLGESDLPKEVKLEFLKDPELRNCLEANPGIIERLEKLKDKDPDLLGKIMADGVVSEKELEVLASPFSKELKKELLDLSDHDKIEALKYLEKINPEKADDKVLGFVGKQNLSQLKEYTGKLNSLSQKVETGDNLTKISRELLVDADKGTQDAFIGRYYPDHEEITSENREKLLEMAINKMSVSNLDMSDGNNVQNLIYKGNEVNINSETGEIYVKKGGSELEARAVSEQELRDNWADKRARQLGADPQKVDFGKSESGEKEILAPLDVNGQTYELVVDEDNNWRVEDTSLSGKFKEGESVADIKERIRQELVAEEVKKVSSETLDPKKRSQLMILKELGVDPEKELSSAEKQKILFAKNLMESSGDNWKEEFKKVISLTREIKRDPGMSEILGDTHKDYSRLHDFLNHINHKSFNNSSGSKYLKDLIKLKFSLDPDLMEKGGKSLFGKVMGNFDLSEVEVLRSSGGDTKIILPHENWGPNSDWEVLINWNDNTMVAKGPFFWRTGGDISKDSINNINEMIEKYFNQNDPVATGRETVVPEPEEFTGKDLETSSEKEISPQKNATQETKIEDSEKTPKDKEDQDKARTRSVSQAPEELEQRDPQEVRVTDKEISSLEGTTSTVKGVRFKYNSEGNVTGIDYTLLKSDPRKLIDWNNPESEDLRNNWSSVSSELRNILGYQKVLKELETRGEIGSKEYEWTKDEFQNMIDRFKDHYGDVLEEGELDIEKNTSLETEDVQKNKTFDKIDKEGHEEVKEKEESAKDSDGVSKEEEQKDIEFKDDDKGNITGIDHKPSGFNSRDWVDINNTETHRLAATNKWEQVEDDLREILKHQDVLQELDARGETGSEKYERAKEQFRDQVDRFKEEYGNILDESKLYSVSSMEDASEIGGEEESGDWSKKEEDENPSSVSIKRPEFRYDDKGNVSNVNYGVLGFRAEDFLDSDSGEFSGLSGEEQSKIGDYMEKIVGHQALLNKMEEKGETGRQEHEWLKKELDRHIKSFEKDYGKILDKQKLKDLRP